LGKNKSFAFKREKAGSFTTAGYHGNEFYLISQIIQIASAVQSVFILHPSLQLQSPFSNLIIYIFWTYQILLP
jgi:hypothetical protein